MTKGRALKWIEKAGIRAVKTFAQTLLGFVVIGHTFTEINWAEALSVSGVALIASLLTSLAGLPELKKSKIETAGDIVVDPETSDAFIDFDSEDSAKVTPGDTISFNVVGLNQNVNEGDKDDSDV